MANAIYDLQETARTDVEFVTIAELKNQCRLPAASTDHDSDLTDLRTMAIADIEAGTDRPLANVTMQMRARSLPADRRQQIYLPKGPIQSVSSVTYYDSNGAQQTVDAANYEVVTGDDGFIQANANFDWPAGSVDIDRALPVEIIYAAGYASAGNVPPLAKQAVKLLVAFWFSFRMAGNEKVIESVPMGYGHLLDRLRTGHEFKQYGVW